MTPSSFQTYHFNMKITKKYDWNRRDFRFDSKCEGCGHEETKNSGYDDSYFYNSVMPDRKCDNCKKSSKDLGTVEITTPKYDPNLTL